MEKFKIKNGEYRYRESIYIGYKKINSPSFKRITDAKAWKARMETEKFSKLAHGENYFEQQNILFSDFAKRWLETTVKVKVVHRTYQGYESYLRVHLLPRFGKMFLRDIKEEHGNQLLSELKKTHTAKGIHNIWQVMKAVLLKARRDKLISCDPWENLQRPKLDLKEDTYWIRDEINQFLRANTQDQLYPFFFVAIHTGMRLAELCGLCWDRVNFNLNQITVSRTRDKTGLKDSTKTKLKRIIPMTPEVRSILLSIHQKRLNGSFIFVEKNGEEVKYAHVYRRFGKAQEKAGITNKIRFHDLRHSFASNYMMNGGNVFDLQKLLGHTKIDMTMKYAHFTPDHLQGSLRFMNMMGENESNIPMASQRENFEQEKVVMLVG